VSKRLWTDERIKGSLHSYVGGSKTISFLDAQKMRDEYETLIVELKKGMDTQCLIRYAVSDELDAAKERIKTRLDSYLGRYANAPEDGVMKNNLWFRMKELLWVLRPDLDDTEISAALREKIRIGESEAEKQWQTTQKDLA